MATLAAKERSKIFTPFLQYFYYFDLMVLLHISLAIILFNQLLKDVVVIIVNEIKYVIIYLPTFHTQTKITY